MYQLVDFFTKNPVIHPGLVFNSGTDVWEVQLDMAAIKAQLDLDYFKIEPPCLAKYLPLLPIASATDFVSLHEMATPLVASRTLGPDLNMQLSFKVEGKNPTGSFKDRGSAIDISMAKELGAKAVILASTGNMAASCACYAAAAKLPCYVLVPADVEMNKLAQVIAFGGLVVKIKGTYNDAQQLALVLAQKLGFYLAGDYAFRVEGQKTAAFELLDQLAYDVPDIVIIPMGCGTNITAYAKGFAEYQQLGLIKQSPRLFGVQAQGAAAIIESFNAQQQTITPFKEARTLASAIAVPDPIDGIKALHAIYNSHGLAIAVSDEEILHAQHLLATQESLFAESAAAASFAALLKIAPQLDAQQKIVCILTGDGLKDAHVVLDAAKEPLIIDANEEAFMQIKDRL